MANKVPYMAQIPKVEKMLTKRNVCSQGCYSQLALIMRVSIQITAGADGAAGRYSIERRRDVSFLIGRCNPREIG